MFRLSIFMFVAMVAVLQSGCAVKDPETHRMESLRQAYIAAIKEKIQKNWQKPVESFEAVKCEVRVMQGPGGIIMDVTFNACDGGSLNYRDSIEQAILNAEPLPRPGDPGLFDRQIDLVFYPPE